MDSNKINQIEYKFFIQQLKLYDKVSKKIIDNFAEMPVDELADYFEIAADIKTNITAYLDEQKKSNSIKETFNKKNYK